MSAGVYRCLHIFGACNRGLLNDPYILPYLKIYDISMTCLPAHFHQISQIFFIQSQKMKH